MQDLEKILDYLMDEKDCTEVAAGQVAAKLTKYDDIKTEFLGWLATGKYPVDVAVTVNGYTAVKISEIAPVLDGAGVYNFLVTLRDNPEEARQIIAEGFVAK